MKIATDKHPVLQMLEKIFAQMEESGITLSWTPYGKIIVETKQYGVFYLYDLEARPGDHTESNIHQFPPVFEYKILKPEPDDD